MENKRGLAARIDEHIASIRMRVEKPHMPVGLYDSKAMDALTMQYKACEQLIAEAYKIEKDPETGATTKKRNPTKEKKIKIKAALLDLIVAFDRHCPDQLLLELAHDKTILEGARPSAFVEELARLRRTYENSVLSPRLKAALAVSLRAESDKQLTKLVERIDALRKGIKPIRERVWSLEDVNPDSDIRFAESFVKAVEHDRVSLSKREPDRKVLVGLEALDRLAHKTSSFLALLKYSKTVSEIATEMREHPAALWEDHSQEFADRLKQASETFKRDVGKAHTTQQPMLIFGQQDAKIHQVANSILRTRNPAIVRRFTTHIEMASEHLNNLALTFLKGGPADQKAWLELGEPRSDGSHDIPKLLTRIAIAYKRDRARTAERLKMYEEDVSSDRGSENIRPDNKIRDKSATMDFVYTARWALAAQKLLDLIKDRAVLADPTIDVVEKENTHIGDIQPMHHAKRVRSAHQPDDSSITGLPITLIRGPKVTQGMARPPRSRAPEDALPDIPITMVERERDRRKNSDSGKEGGVSH